jgi:hypothetical protein
MTLLDAPNYDPAKARNRRTLLIVALSICVVTAGLTWFFWNWPQEHLVNQFFAAVESYPYGRFELDWGHASEWGDIKSHKIVMSKTTGSGVVVGVDINGQKTPTFLWVERKNKTIGFSPVELSTE